MSTAGTVPMTWMRVMDDLFDRFVAGPALLLLAFGALYDVGLANTGMGVLLVATIVLAPLHRHTLKRDLLAWLALTFVVWTPASAWLHAIARPEWSYTIWNTAGDWILTPFLGSLAVAFWLARQHRLIPWLLGMMVAGYLLRVGEGMSIAQLERMMLGTERATFGDAATNFGTWSLITLLALVALLPSVLDVKGKALRALGALPWAAATAVAAAGLVLSQARAAWLAAVAVLPVTMYLWLRARFPGLRRGALLAAATVAMLILLAAVSLVFSTVLERRFSDHRETIVQILSGDLETLPSNSPGYRLRMYFEGMETWWQRPLLGQGPGASEIALAESEDTGIRRFKDAHNSYLVVIVEFGLLGLVVLGAFVVELIRRGRRAYSAGWLRVAHADLLVGALVVLGVTQFFQYSIHSYRGPFVIALLCGMAWAYRFSEANNDPRLQMSVPHVR